MSSRPASKRAAAPRERIAHSRPTVGADDARAVAEVVAGGMLVGGSRVAAFENDLAQGLGLARAAAVHSGSAALHLALQALGVGDRDRVAVPSFGCVSLLQAVRRTGAEPSPVDCHPETFQMDVDDLRRRLRPRTRAIVTVHTFGLPAAVEPVRSLGLPVIEDIATAIGASRDGRALGSEGCCAVCSFNATKMMTTGGGGAVASNDASLIDAVADRIDYDARSDRKVRYNERMGEMAAALGLRQLARLDAFVERRARLAESYRKELSGIPGLALPTAERGSRPAWHRFVVRVERGAGEVRAELDRQGVDSPPPVARPLHRILGMVESGFPGTEQAVEQALSLPIYPELTGDEVRHVAEVVRRCVSRG